MTTKRKLLLGILVGLAAGVPFVMTKLTRLSEIRTRVVPVLHREMEKKGLALGLPLHIRVYKESKELELWLQPSKGAAWKLFKTYPIKNYGRRDLGPKTQEGDQMAPEGFYAFGKASLNPNSNYHLSFNVGYPNALDKLHGRTGSFIMVHGAEVSVGCFAMGDPAIEEIYLVAEAALAAGQKEISLHAFPFRPTEARLAKAAKDHETTKPNPWLAFWRDELAPAEAAFLKELRVPQIRVDSAGKRYVVGN